MLLFKRHPRSLAEYTGPMCPWTRLGPVCVPGSQDLGGSTSEAVCCLRPTPRPGRLVPLGRGPRRSQGAVPEPSAQAGMPKGAAAAGSCPGQRVVGRKPRVCRQLQRRGCSAVSPAVGVCVSFGDSETRFLSVGKTRSQGRTGHPPSPAWPAEPRGLTCTSESRIFWASLLRSRGPR